VIRPGNDLLKVIEDGCKVASGNVLVCWIGSAYRASDITKLGVHQLHIISWPLIRIVSQLSLPQCIWILCKLRDWVLHDLRAERGDSSVYWNEKAGLCSFRRWL